jgi:single-stranded DNA-binding protein
MALSRRELGPHPSKGDRVLVVGGLIQRTFEVESQKRSSIEIQVHLQFATAEEARSTSEDFGSSSAEEKHSA